MNIINSENFEFGFNDLERHSYIKDIEVKVDMYRDSVKITDLRNALKAGKTCDVWTLSGSEDGRIILYEELRERFDIASYVKALREGKDFEHKYELRKYEEKACRVYSPFAKVPKQNLLKITPARLPKAIANGQIKSIVVASRYTDDYKYDAATNFGEGIIKNVHEVAEDLTKSSTGWWISNNEVSSFELHCYSFLSYKIQVA